MRRARTECNTGQPGLVDPISGNGFQHEVPAGQGCLFSAGPLGAGLGCLYRVRTLCLAAPSYDPSDPTASAHTESDKCTTRYVGTASRTGDEGRPPLSCRTAPLKKEDSPCVGHAGPVPSRGFSMKRDWNFSILPRDVFPMEPRGCSRSDVLIPRHAGQAKHSAKFAAILPRFLM